MIQPEHNNDIENNLSRLNCEFSLIVYSLMIVFFCRYKVLLGLAARGYIVRRNKDMVEKLYTNGGEIISGEPTLT